jgi:spoIIIJ-associated protein
LEGEKRMNEHKYVGKTKEEAVQAAIEDLQELEENLIIRESSEQKGGLFKAKKVEITVVEKRDVNKYIKDFIIDTIKKLGFSANVELKVKDNVPNYTIFSDNDSLLIGKTGKNLSALTLVVREHISKVLGKSYRFVIDVSDYKEKNDLRLERLAKKIARDVKFSKVEAKLDPMNSYERRVIHNALGKNKYVTTESEGEEPNRYVVIKPVEQKEKKDKEEE